MTELQEVVSRMCNIYPDETFIEMVEVLDDPEYWMELDHENLTDNECIKVLHRLGSMYSEWNSY